MTMLKRYRADAFRQFQMAVMKVRGGKMQVELLQAAAERSGNDFVNWLEATMRQCAGNDDIIIGDEEPPVPPQPSKYSAAHFLQPPDHAKMWESWKSIPPGVACSPATWAYIVGRLVAAGKIEPRYLAVSPNGAETDGGDEIRKALAKTGEEKAKEVDKCVRAFLRRLSGLLERGARSVYQNCPPARAWWQHYIADQVAQKTGKEKKDVMKLLRAPAVWELLSDKMASRLTVIGDRNLRDGIVMFLLDNNGAKFSGSKKTLNRLFADIGVMAAWRALGYFPPKRVEEILTAEIAPHISEDSTSGDDSVKSPQ